jgi:ribosomal protein L11 methylase PrmA
MSAIDVQRIMFRAIDDPEYRRQLLADPDRALSGYQLAADEQANLKALTPDLFYRVVGGYVAHRLVPLRFGGRFVVRPPSPQCAAGPDDVPIILGPHWAFGNGSHATTESLLIALGECVRPGDAILDIGTGTGILAIAAARLGAASVLAVDNDAEAVDAARQNVQLNGVEAVVRVEPASLEYALQMIADGLTAGWDVVAVNINATVALNMLKGGLRRTVRPGGTLIVSAIKSAEEVTAVDEGLRSAGLHGVDHRSKNGWLTVIARREEEAHVGNADAPDSPPSSASSPRSSPGPIR